MMRWIRLSGLCLVAFALVSACGGGGGGGISFLRTGDYDVTIKTATPTCSGFDISVNWRAGLLDYGDGDARITVYVPEEGGCGFTQIRLEGTWVTDTQLELDDKVGLQVCVLEETYGLRSMSIRNGVVDFTNDRAKFHLRGDFEGTVDTRICFGIITMSGVDT